MSNLIEAGKDTKIGKIEDRWIISKLNSLIEKFTNELENMHPHLATRMLQEFWLKDLSRGYIQFVRDRLQEDEEAKSVLRKVYLQLVKLLAPICPFVTEKIWQELKDRKIMKEASVHLADWPEPGSVNEKLEKEFETAREIIELGLAERDKIGIGLKWPLAKAEIFSERKISKELLEIIKRQVNVKKIEIRQGEEMKVILDTKMTKELEAEGYAREIARMIQAERKKAGFIKENLIKLKIILDKELLEMLKSQEKFIKERVNADKILLSLSGGKRFKYSSVFKIKEKSVSISFDRV